MRRASMLAAMLLLAGICVESTGQSSQAASRSQVRGAGEPQTTSLQLATHKFRPKLQMQDALKIAESYLDKQHINISSYWLSEARYILYGEEKRADKDKIPCWHFWWMSDTVAMGDYVEILVDMNGNAWRAPSM